MLNSVWYNRQADASAPSMPTFTSQMMCDWHPPANTVTSDDVGKQSTKLPHRHCPMCWGDDFYWNGTTDVCRTCLGIAPNPILCFPEICGSS